MRNLPLYQKIIDDIKSKIVSGELSENDKVPTELEISKEYKVSRITSKRALSELENENLIYRIQGKGSFIAPKISNSYNSPSKNILFISPFVNNSSFGDYAQGIINYLQNTGYTLHMKPNDILNQSSFNNLIDDYAGFIVYPESSTSDLDIFYSLYLKNQPTVILDKQFLGIPFTTVAADNFQGGYIATNHLIELSHKKIAFFSTRKIESTSSIRERYLGYLKALHDNNLDFHIKDINPTKWDNKNIDNYYNNAIDYYKRENITGIIAENDLCAISLIKSINKKNLKVPEDFSVIGFDNIQASSLIEPSLSTVSQNFELIGYTAAKQLVSLIEKKRVKTSDIVIPVEFIHRNSTR